MGGEKMKTKKYEIYKIKWDTENNGVLYSQQKLGLPSSLIIDIDEDVSVFDNKGNITLEAEETINDILADNFDWCVFSWEIKEIS